MRKIYYEVETTPEPCSAEKKYVDDINKNIKDLKEDIIKQKSIISAAQADIDFSIIKIDSYYYAIKDEEVNQEILDSEIQLKTDEYKKNCGYLPTPWCYFAKQEQDLLEAKYFTSKRRVTNYLQPNLEMARSVLSKAKNIVSSGKFFLEKKEEKLTEENANLKKAEAAYKACLSKTLAKTFNLKLNPSCKEIKQKIKTVNQKIISLNHELFDLKYGVNGLPILKLNKKLSDNKIKSTKELLVKLDKLNPIIFISEKLTSKKLNNITPDSSFYAIYKKVKDDLASYQTEGKTLEAKIKNLKEKNIPDKKNKLKDKFSKLFKKFKNC